MDFFSGGLPLPSHFTILMLKFSAQLSHLGLELPLHGLLLVDELLLVMEVGDRNEV